VGGIVVNGTLFGTLFFLEGNAQVAMLLICIGLAVWWYRKFTKEEAKHYEVMHIHKGKARHITVSEKPATVAPGVMVGYERYDTKEGTPQGGVFSPLLANLSE
jgi:hypothetical protein